VFAEATKTRGLNRVSADGGELTIITRPDPKAGELDHVWPEFLPGGKSVLFTISSTSGQLSDAQIAVLDLQSGKYKTVLRSGSHAHYLKTGHLVYGAYGTLRAIAFDIDKLRTVGSPIPVLSNVVTTAAGAANFDVAGDGTLAYVSGGFQTVERSLVWVDRQGREEPLKEAPLRAYTYPRLSPDGSRIALDIRDQDDDIWVWDSARGLTRLTQDPAEDRYPIWKPDGQHLIFSSGSPPNMYSQPADGTEAPQRLVESPRNQFAHSITRDGKWLVYSESTQQMRRNLMMLALDRPQDEQPLLRTQFVEQNGALSPNEQWLAYESNETGEYEIYVRPFPAVNSGPKKVSTNGGSKPVWRRDGKELFFWDKSGALMGVAIRPGLQWSAGLPSKILEPGVYIRGNEPAAPTYDVSLDGQRFLMIKPLADSREDAAPMTIVVIQNWFEELKRVVAAK
jgi:serine/threonine-protein kinase